MIINSDIFIEIQSASNYDITAAMPCLEALYIILCLFGWTYNFYFAI